MKVAIIGAGFAGLATARALAKAGVEVRIYEKSHVLGGRVATRKVDDYLFDTGATSIAPRSLHMHGVMLNELPVDDLIKLSKPIWTIQRGHAAPGDPTRNQIDRYVYRQGMNQLARLLAEDLDIQREVLISDIGREGELNVEGERYDWVVITAPVPQTMAILQKAGDERDLGQVHYRSCLSVLLGYQTPNPVVGYHALVDTEQSQPVQWVSMESIKSPDRAPDGHSAFVVQMASQYSKARYEGDDSVVIKDAVSFLDGFFEGDFSHPKVAQVKKWKYSQSETPLSFEEANPMNSRILVAGDGISGPRIELAYESGLAAAARILEVSGTSSEVLI